MSTCKSCGARIIWCVTEQGKRMPVDRQPSNDGTVHVFECPEDGTDMCEVLGDILKRELAREQGEFLYKSHFATCPNAKQHRKG